MRIYLAERQRGKTTMLVKQSAKTGAIIVVPTYQTGKCVALIAHDLGLKIPEPITVTKYIQILVSEGLRKTQKYLVDELQTVLDVMNVESATVDINSTELIPKGDRHD